MGDGKTYSVKYIDIKFNYGKVQTYNAIKLKKGDIKKNLKADYPSGKRKML